jgi:hypothetical protein
MMARFSLRPYFLIQQIRFLRRSSDLFSLTSKTQAGFRRKKNKFATSMTRRPAGFQV